MKEERVEFFELKGAKIKNIYCENVTLLKGYDPLYVNEVTFDTDKGKFKIYHEQDCCESCYLYKVIGNPYCLQGYTVKLAESEFKNEHPEWYKEDSKYANNSFTWSCYYLENSRGNRVEFWFLGESNGYYCEVTDFIKL